MTSSKTRDVNGHYAIRALAIVACVVHGGKARACEFAMLAPGTLSSDVPLRFSVAPIDWQRGLSKARRSEEVACNELESG